MMTLQKQDFLLGFSTFLDLNLYNFKTQRNPAYIPVT